MTPATPAIPASLWSLVEEINTKIGTVLGDLNAQAVRLTAVESRLTAIEANLAILDTQGAAVLANLVAINKSVALIQTAVIPPLPTAFSILLTQGVNKPNMSKPAVHTNAAVDFELLDDGSATGSLTGTDTENLTVPFPAGTTSTWTPSAPSIVATVNADGISATITPATPPVEVTGVTILVIVTLPNGTVLTSTSGAIDVVPDQITGFSIALTANAPTGAPVIQPVSGGGTPPVINPVG